MSDPEPRPNAAASVSRTDRASARATLEKISQMEQRVMSLERAVSSQLYSRRHEFRKVFCSLEDADIKLSQGRKTEMKELSQQISRIRSNVQSFRKMLDDMKPGPSFMERLKQVLEETETSILSFKDRQRQVYEGLLVEERQISQEVTAFQRRLEAWTTAGRPVTAPAPAVAEREVEVEDRTLPPAVHAFERFLRQTGGHRGGWDNYDHNTFLRLKNKHPNENVFVEAALRELPTRTESEVKAHCAWYTEYCALLEAKRSAIQDWKKSREVARSQQLKAVAVRETDSESSRRKQKAEQEKRELERRLNKDKLQAWKAEQEQRRKAADEVRVKEEEMKAKKVASELARQAVVREQVREYQEVRERERQAVAEQERQRREAQERELQLQAKREIEKFRERDMRAVAEKKERDRQKEVAWVEQKMRLDRLKEQVAVSVERDPERVLRPTSGWRERKKAREKEHQQQQEGGNLRNRAAGVGVGARELPRRAVPAWRQGL